MTVQTVDGKVKKGGRKASILTPLAVTQLRQAEARARRRDRRNEMLLAFAVIGASGVIVLILMAMVNTGGAL